MYLSPRLLRGYLVQKYILNDPFNKFPNFEISHIQSSKIIDILRNRGVQLPEFIYYQGVQGPIKIWKIKYDGDEKIKEDYLVTEPPSYITWQF